MGRTALIVISFDVLFGSTVKMTLWLAVGHDVRCIARVERIGQGVELVKDIVCQVLDRGYVSCSRTDRRDHMRRWYGQVKAVAGDGTFGYECVSRWL